MLVVSLILVALIENHKDMKTINLGLLSKKCVRCGTRTEWRVKGEPCCVSCLNKLVEKGLEKEKNVRH